MNWPSDRSLVTAARSGDQQAAGRLLERHGPEAWRAAYAVCRDHAIADDALQEGSIRAMRYLDSFDQTRPFPRWFQAIVMTINTNSPHGLLGSLRALNPGRALEPHEALGVAERQALRLLSILDQHQPAIDVGAIGELPRIEVRVEPNLPVSGFSQWSRGRWLIGVNQDDAPVRRRFTLAHEFKHVLDHPYIDSLYLDRKGRPSERRAEAVCDYFAACLLMPRPWVKQAYTGGVQDQRALAQLFGVSEAAMALRLRQLGLTVERPRWKTLGSGDGTGVSHYFRRGLPAMAAERVRVGGPLLAGGGS